LGALEELHDRYGDRVSFFVVYIKEAHPEDGWVLSDNRDHGIAVVDPASEAERAEVAEACAARLEIRMPVLLDATDDEVARRYGGWPDRLYLIARDGRVAFQGGEGPFGFKPEELEAAIEAELATHLPRPGRT
jgi:Iodothyronine deiodinase